MGRTHQTVAPYAYVMVKAPTGRGLPIVHRVQLMSDEQSGGLVRRRERSRRSCPAAPASVSRKTCLSFVRIPQAMRPAVSPNEIRCIARPVSPESCGHFALWGTRQMLSRHADAFARQLNHMPQTNHSFKMIFGSVEDELNGDIEARRIHARKSRTEGAGPNVGLWSPDADDATPLASARRELFYRSRVPPDDKRSSRDEVRALIQR